MKSLNIPTLNHSPLAGGLNTRWQDGSGARHTRQSSTADAHSGHNHYALLTGQTHFDLNFSSKEHGNKFKASQKDSPSSSLS